MQIKMDRIKQLSCVVLASALLSPVALATHTSQAADYIDSAPAGISDAGICSQQRVLRRVNSQFNYQVRHVPNLPQVAIASVGDIRMTRFEPKTNVAQIERTYCQATGAFTDGEHRSIWYVVEGGQGFAGVGNNVEMCVADFDRWNVYNAHCRTLR